MSLGYFDDEIEAATAYDDQATKMRGAAAVRNFQSCDKPKSAEESPNAGNLVESDIVLDRRSSKGME